MSDSQTSYGFHERDRFSKPETRRASNYLKSLDETIDVENVESDGDYQEIDVDLIWRRTDENGEEERVLVEVKVDEYTASTRNIAVETVANVAKGTLGCFIKTAAKYIFYIEEQTKVMYVLDREKSLEFFLLNRENYQEKMTSTKDKRGHGRVLYYTKFYPVPIKHFSGEGCILGTVNLSGH